MDTRRQNCCGMPACDHHFDADTPVMRYPLKAAVRHYLLEKMAILSRGWRQ